MDASHKLLLLAILGIIVWLAIAMVRLVHRGMVAAQTGLRWREMDDLQPERRDGAPHRLAPHRLAPHRLLFTLSLSYAAPLLKRILRFLWPQETSQAKAPFSLTEQILADPIDGTTFQQGEAIVRCACGAAYHAYTWQWLAANNGGKCVSCKRAS
jgi:hypothetical protein